MQNRKDRVENTFPYQLLSRLEQDCKYFLGAGNGYEGHLWTGDVEAQIKKMKDLYDRLPETPEWITMEDIENYEKEMLALKDSKQKKEAVCKSYDVINHTDDELEVLDEDVDDEPYYYDPEEDFSLFKDYDELETTEPVEEEPDEEEQSDWDWLVDGELDYEKLREELEDNEDEVECQGCFETFNKADCVKGEHGYYCKECAGLHEDLEESAGVHVGDTIKIINMDGEPQYSGKTGVVKTIDDIGQIHGTWGGCAIIPEIDEFEIVSKAANEALKESVGPMEYFKKLINSRAKDKDFMRRATKDIYYVDEVANGRYSIAELSDKELKELEQLVAKNNK